MQPYRFRLAVQQDKKAIVDFMNTHWETRHPLVNLPDFFAYYYDAGGGRLNFALALREEKIVALAGYIPANIKIRPDIWVSLWVADKSAKGAGLELMNALPGLTGCRVMACNNIRPETRSFYEFLGYATGRIGHFYRLGRTDGLALARVEKPERLPVAGSAQLALYPTAEALEASGFIPPEKGVPYKDYWYITRRYYEFPRQSYRVYGVLLPGQRRPAALLCARVVDAGKARVLRIADYIGPVALLPELGCAVDALIAREGAEYADFYCAGIPAGIMAAMGFTERAEGSGDIIPHYLTPPLIENTDFYYFTNKPEGFVLCKADGDQDRPNLPAPNESNSIYLQKRGTPNAKGI